jgi:hypothetical protein
MFLFKHFSRSNKKPELEQKPPSIHPRFSHLNKDSNGDTSVVPLKNEKKSAFEGKSSSVKQSQPSLSDRSHLHRITEASALKQEHPFISSPDIWMSGSSKPISIPHGKITRSRKSISPVSSFSQDSFENNQVVQTVSEIGNLSGKKAESPFTRRRLTKSTITELSHMSTQQQNSKPSSSNVQAKNSDESLTPFERTMIMGTSGYYMEYDESSTEHEDDFWFKSVRPMENETNLFIGELKRPIQKDNKRWVTVVIKKQKFLEENRISKYRSLHESNIHRFLSDAIFASSKGYPFIVSFVGHTAIHEENLHFIIMEYCNRGTLLDFINERVISASTPILRMLLHDVALGLCFIHEKNIAHRDMKLENIFLTWDKKRNRVVAKIGDFGHACQIFKETKDTYSLCSADYAPPELFLGIPHNSILGDLWSYGVCLYASFERHFPFVIDRNKFGTFHIPEAYGSLKFGEYEFQYAWMSGNEMFIDLIGKLITFNPICRLKMEDVLKHPFFLEIKIPLIF